MTSEPKKNKQLLFLVAQPRSGNTLFASIMNQNPEIAATPNSITLEIMKDLHLLKQTDVFLNYQDHKSLDNVLDSVFDTYYKDWPQRIIIDRGPVMTKGNFGLMQKHFKRPFKCIVLLRDLMDVLASYIKWFETEPTAFPNQYKTLDEKLSHIMHKNGAMAKELMSIQYLLKHPERAVFIKYDDLVMNPEKELRKVYTFLNLPYYQHQFTNLNQIIVNGMQYNDSIVGKNMHTIRTEKVMKVENEYKNKIPQRFVKEYGHITF